MKRTPKTYAEKIVLTFFVILFIAIPATPHGVRHAEALSLGGLGGDRVTIVADTSVVGVTNTLKNTLSEVSTYLSAGVDAALKLKELTLDGLAWNIAQNALNQITADMINWVNGGFNGEPAFITDLEGYLLGIVDEAAGEFIFGQELQRLCEPLRLPVPSTIIIQYTTVGRPNESVQTQCSLEEFAGADVQAFMEGDFSKGGWGAFFELTIGNRNDTLGAHLDGKVQLYANNIEKKRLAEQEVGYGDGVAPQKNCEYIESATGFSRKKCETMTPGFLVRDAISFAVGELPALKLVQADELDEIIGALAGNLMNQALQGTYGLLGLGGNSRYTDNRFGTGNQSYSDALRGEVDGSVRVSTSELDAAIAANTDYRNLQNDVLDDIEELEDAIAEGEERYPSCFDLELTDNLQTDKENAEANREIADQVIAVLQKMLDLAGDGTITQQNAVYQQYLNLQSEGLVKTTYDVTKLEIEFIEIEFANRVAEFETRIEAEENHCD